MIQQINPRLRGRAMPLMRSSPPLPRRWILFRQLRLRGGRIGGRTLRTVGMLSSIMSGVMLVFFPCEGRCIVICELVVINEDQFSMAARVL